MEKKIIASVLALTLTIGGLAVPVAESNVISNFQISASAQAEEEYNYEVLNDNTIRITKYKGENTTITIPSTIVGRKVTRIADKAFVDSSLRSVSIPSTVTAIGVDAFTDCSSMKEILVDSENKNYSSVDGLLFNKEKTALICCPKGRYDAYVPYGVKNIRQKAFSNCGRLRSIYIPTSVKEISSNAFEHCKALKKVVVPSSVKKIGAGAFNDCVGLEKVILPNTITTISSKTFQNCIKLQKITIPKSVKSIGSYAFDGCNGLLSLTIPGTVTTVGSYAFSNCDYLSKVEIGTGVKTIGKAAFSGSQALKSVKFSSTVKTIGEEAFYKCTSLKAVRVPKTVTKIGTKAFGFYFDNKKTMKLPGFTFKCYKNTAAYSYAKRSGIKPYIVK